MLQLALRGDHPFLISSTFVNEICQPLKNLGITHMTYLKNFKDGSQIKLCNNAKWIEHYYQLTLYKTSLFEDHPYKYHSGYLIWPNDSDLEVFVHGRNYFDSDHGITIVKKSENYSEFFLFSGSRKNKSLTNFYVNNLDILEKFILYFKNKLADVLKEAEKSRIVMPERYCQPAMREIEMVGALKDKLSVLKQQFSQERFAQSSLPIKTPFNKTTLDLLSGREVDIVTCLLQGMTAKETGKQLFISQRTVERHLDNVKDKLNCKTKFELVNKLLHN